MRLITTLLLLILLFSSCLGNHWKAKAIALEKDVGVWKEQYIQEERVVDQDFAHPFTLDEQKMTEILLGLNYLDNPLFKEPVPTPVFTAEEANLLSPALVKGFAEASPNERLRFESYNWGGGLIFSAKRITQGVLFIKPANKLNIAFSQVNDELDPGEETEADYRSPRPPLKIKSSVTSLQPKIWYSLFVDTPGEPPRPLWAVVDLKQIDAIFAVARKEPEPPVVEKVVEKPPVLAPVPEKEPVEAFDPIRIQLEKLKQYFDEGLIDEEEYKAQKKQVLEGGS